MAFQDRVRDAGVKIAVLDIETKPAQAYVWGGFKQNVYLDQIIEPPGMLCFAVRWVGTGEVEFYSEWADGQEAMIQAVHSVLDEADIVVGYNSDNFDIKHINAQLALQGMTPPRPYKKIDLMHESRANFRWFSGKLDFLGQQLVGDKKTEHEGFTLWVKCMSQNNDDPAVREARAKMEEYNRQDVLLTEKVYIKMLPWLKKAPHMGLFMETDQNRCPHCGSTSLVEDDASSVKAQTTTYLLQYCADCSAWSRTTMRARENDKLLSRKVV